MIGSRTHPAWRELNLLADAELDADSRGPAMEHVAGCSKCSRNVSLLHGLREAGRDMRHPSPPKGLLDDILRDRSEGVRIILPAAPPPLRPRRRALPAVAASAILASLAGLAILTLSTEAGAGASELMFFPAQPVPGELVRVEYRPGTALAGQTALRLRVRLRQDDSEPPRGLLGSLDEVILVPDADGRYVGTYQLPPDFAYASTAVESLTGDQLDDRQGRLWGLRAHDIEGVPLLGALRQEFLVLQHRSWPEAEDALRQMTIDYPESAEGWSTHLAYERHSQSPGERAASMAGHREMFRILEEASEHVELSATEMAAMVRYADELGDLEARNRWLARLGDVDPAHRLVVSSRVARLGPGAADSDLERLWSDDRYETVNVCETGYLVALGAPDPEAGRRWAARCLPLKHDDHWSFLAMALTLASHEETRERGVAEIRTLLAHMDEAVDEERPLHATPAEARRESRRLLAALQVRLGEHLLASGQAADALLELDAADTLGVWMPALYRARLEAKLSLGEVAGALADFHRLAVDPVYSRASVDSLLRRFPSLTPADLARGRKRAEDEIRRRVLADQYRRGLPALQLGTATGQSRSLEGLLAGRPTILLVWDRRVLDSPDAVAEVIEAGRILAGGPSQVLWITPEPPSEALRAFARAQGLGLPSYHDAGSELATSLGAWGARSYFVIDRAGVIRARTHSLMEAVRHLEVPELGSRTA